ncbi:hypothetical protein [Nocardia arthritidis]|uniref:DUF4190 domain-containing protein n=1 Tax=Nocardia arthritidis TaxID=228602 RepID=A0A6G9YS53_9NOCA|nr:hypothetical protein [Nocardia arthritidis]QIS15713.1 hypothetical protein F5544_39475 [Nocardia arthritidis]
MTTPHEQPSGDDRRTEDEDIYPPPDTLLQRLGNQGLSLFGFLCAALALLFCPVLFGPAGIVIGLLAHGKGEWLGKWAALAAALATVLGTVLAFLYWNSGLRTGSTG